MNRKKKPTKFFTWNRKAEGFTLIELIVVIAILAILAGVGTVAYTGYVNSANKAADEALLKEINTAFAAACTAKGLNYYGYDRADVTLPLTADKKVGTLAVTAVPDFDDVFKTFFENTDVAFKVFERLEYDRTIGGFKGITGNLFSQVFAGLNLQSYVNTVNSSTFGTIGASGLMEQVGDVTDFAAALMGIEESTAGVNLKTALIDDDFFAAAGFESADEFFTYLTTLDTAAEQNAYMNKLLANYAVLQVAQTTANGNTTDLLDGLKEGFSVTEIKDMMGNSNPAESRKGVAKAAMMYAMYTAYANGLTDEAEKNAALAHVADMDTFAGFIMGETNDTNSKFMDYLDSDQATTDMQGFQASMNIINESTQDAQAKVNLVQNGYNTPELIEALTALLGR